MAEVLLLVLLDELLPSRACPCLSRTNAKSWGISLDCVEMRYYRRHRVDWPIFRLSVMKLVAAARSRLVAAASLGPKQIYVGDGDMAGLGKNYMTEAARLAGIDVYKLHLRRYGI